MSRQLTSIGRVVMYKDATELDKILLSTIVMGDEMYVLLAGMGAISMLKNMHPQYADHIMHYPPYDNTQATFEISKSTGFLLSSHNILVMHYDTPILLLQMENN